MTDLKGTTHTRPLAGIRVVEQGTFITGPFASLLLADMGAEVIKVERPDGGDPFRHYDGTTYASTFQSVNRNKSSITLDNHSGEDRETLHQLVRSADVFIHNFRSGAADRMGIDSGTLLAVNPTLVYCAISGLGKTGPYATLPSYDTVAQSLSGMLSMTLDPNDPQIAGPALADAVTGLYAAQGILAALLHRERDGRGHVVELSMLESMAHFLIEPYASYFATGTSPGPHSRAASSQSYAVTCADGLLLAIHLSSPAKFWNAVLEVTGLQELGNDPRFSVFTQRLANHEELRHEFQAAFGTNTREYWLRELRRLDVPSAPVLSLSEAVLDPQFRHLGLEIAAEHPSEGVVRSIRPPHSFDGRVTTVVTAPPQHGEHSEEIRRSLSTSPTDQSLSTVAPELQGSN